MLTLKTARGKRLPAVAATLSLAVFGFAPDLDAQQQTIRFDRVDGQVSGCTLPQGQPTPTIAPGSAVLNVSGICLGVNISAKITVVFPTSLQGSEEGLPSGDFILTPPKTAHFEVKVENVAPSGADVYSDLALSRSVSGCKGTTSAICELPSLPEECDFTGCPPYQLTHVEISKGAPLMVVNILTIFTRGGAGGAVVFVKDSSSPVIGDPTAGLDPTAPLSATVQVDFTKLAVNDGALFLRVFKTNDPDPASRLLLISSDPVLISRSDSPPQKTLTLSTVDDGSFDHDIDTVYVSAVLVNQQVVAETELLKIPVRPILEPVMEVTQVTQDPAGSVPMVTGKRTLVRVYPVQSYARTKLVQGIDATVSASYVDQSGVPTNALPDLGPSKFPVQASAKLNRSTTPSNSIELSVPLNWSDAAGSYTLQMKARLLPPPGLVDSQSHWESQPRNVSFVDTRPSGGEYVIGYYPLCMSRIPKTPCPSGGTKITDLPGSYLSDMYPWAYGVLNYKQLDFVHPPWDDTLDTPEKRQKLLSRITDEAHQFGSKVPKLVAWLPLGAVALGLTGKARGIADSRYEGGAGRAAWVVDTEDDTNWRAVAHEVGHLFGLHHTNLAVGAGCSLSADTDPNAWAYSDNTVQDPGWQIDERATFFHPAADFDLMAYCPAALTWISPFHYGQLLSAALLEAVGPAPGGSAPNSKRNNVAARDAAASDYLLITGSASQDGSAGQLDPPYRISSNDPGEVSDPNGTYCIRQSGGGGTPANFCFSPAFTSVDNEPLTTTYFAWKIPYAAGSNSLSLVLRTGGGEQTLASSSSAGAPSISIQAPQPGATLSGQTTIAWTAGDPGGANLTYRCQLSNDGGDTWYPLSYNLTDTQFSFDAGMLLGGSQTYLRVIAMNGVDSTIATVGPLNVLQNPVLRAAPAALDFGSVAVGKTATQSITLTNSGTGLVPITSITSDNAAFVAPAGTMYVAPGQPANVGIRFQPAAPGAQKGTITINGSTTIAVQGVGVVPTAPAITVAPASVDFGSVAIGQSKQLQVNVANHGNATLNILDLVILSDGPTDPSQFGVSGSTDIFKLAPGAQQSATITFKPSARGLQSVFLKISSNDPNQPILRVPITGTGAAGASLSISPTLLDFGSVSAGQSNKLTFTVKNIGSSRVSVGGIGLVGPLLQSFTISPTNYGLDPGQQVLVGVTFHPTDTSPQSETIYLTSTDPASNSVTVTLSGNGGAKGTCAFSLSATTALIGASGGTGSVAVLPAGACPAWTAVSNDPWLTITSGANGVNPVNYSAAANTGLPRSGKLTIAGQTFIVNQKGRLVPFTLDFGNVAVGQTRDLAVNISDIAGDITINSASFTSPLFTAVSPAIPFTVPAGQSTNMIIRFAPTAAGPVSATLTIATSDPTGPTVIVSLTGTGTTATVPQITVAAGLDFGNVVMGLNRSQTLTLSNSGNAALNVSALSTAGPFTVVSPAAPFTVAAGASATVTLRFAPAALGPQTGTLSIASNDPAQPSISVRLSGTASSAAIPGNVIVSDSFQRADASACALGQADLAFGGQGAHFYLPIYPGTSGPIGASIVSGALQNNGLDVGGVQLAAAFGACGSSAIRGESLPQDLFVRVDLYVPMPGGLLTEAGPYFRSRAAAAGDGIVGGTSAGYAVQLVSTGEVRILGLNPNTVIATTSVPAFNPAVIHTLETTVQGSSLRVTLDGVPLAFGQGGAGSVTLPPSSGSNNGTAGILFTANENRGRAGGQRAGNLVIAALTAAGPQIKASPGSVDFGGVTVGQTATQSITLSNAGGSALNVAGLNAAAPFAVTAPATPFTIAAGASAVVTVTFAPAGAGAQSGALTIASNDPVNGSITVPLTGTGVAVPPPSSNIIRTLVHHEITRFTRPYSLNNGGWPVLSANGNRAVFADAPGPEPARTNHIYVVNADGTGLAQVDSYAQACGCGGMADLSADGSRVVSSEGVQLRIAGSGGAKVLVNNRFIAYLRMTADGSRVFFVNYAGTASATDPTTERGVYVINADGSGLRQVVGPTTMAAALQVTPDRLVLTTDGPSLDVSANGARIIFGAQANGQDHLFAVNADGSGLREVLPGIRYVVHAILSGDGSRIGYDIIPPSGPREIGVVNFDGSGRRALVTGIDPGPTLSISGNGSLLLVGGAGRLYSTDGSGALQLTVLGDSSTAPLISDSFNRPTMSAAGDSILYQSADSAGINQLVVMTINPASRGSAPQISSPALSAGSVSVSGATRSTLTATVSSSFPIQIVAAGVLYNGLPDSGILAGTLYDDGTHSDTAAGDGVFTTDRVGANSSATQGPHTIRIKAEVKDAAGARHATAIEFGTLQVQP